MSSSKNDTTRIKEMKEKLRSSETAEVETTSTENAATVAHIGVTHPQPFESFEDSMLIRSSKLIKIFNSLLGDIFTDFNSCTIDQSSLTLKARFVYKDPSTIKEDDDRIIALKTISNEVKSGTHVTNELAEDVKMIQQTQQQQRKKNASTAKITITKEGKAYLQDIIFKGPDKKIYWDEPAIVNYVEQDVPDYTGRKITIICMEVTLSLDTLIRMVFNGTEEYAGYKSNKKYFYNVFYHSAVMGDMILRIIRTDKRKERQIAEDLGYQTNIPSMWNV